MELKLVPVTAENWKKAIFLTTDDTEKYPIEEQWIAANTFSLLQCHYDPDWDCRLMMDGDKAVGFVFYGYWREADHYLLCRYMIDLKEQNRVTEVVFCPLWWRRSAASTAAGMYMCRSMTRTPMRCTCIRKRVLC